MVRRRARRRRRRARRARRRRWGRGASSAAAVLGGRFSSVAAVNVAYIISAEMFPTSCRNSGIGWGTGCGRIGAMLAPLIMATISHPLVTFSILCLGAALSAWLLPESAGTAMADVPDADRRGHLEDGGGDGSRVGTPGDLDHLRRREIVWWSFPP